MASKEPDERSVVTFATLKTDERSCASPVSMASQASYSTLNTHVTRGTHASQKTLNTHVSQSTCASLGTHLTVATHASRHGDHDRLVVKVCRGSNGWNMTEAHRISAPERRRRLAAAAAHRRLNSPADDAGLRMQWGPMKASLIKASLAKGPNSFFVDARDGYPASRRAKALAQLAACSGGSAGASKSAEALRKAMWDDVEVGGAL